MLRGLTRVLMLSALSAAPVTGLAVLPAEAVSPFRDVESRGGSTRPRYVGGIPVPAKARLASVPAAELGAVLKRAPGEGTDRPPLVLELPLPDGSSARFAVRESPLVSPELASRMPGVRTFTARGLDDPAATGRLDLTPAGFHGLVLSPTGTVYIDPVEGSGGAAVAILDKRDVPARETPLLCQVLDGAGALSPARRFASLAVDVGAPLVSPTSLRVARVAFSASSAYTAFHGGKAGAEAAIVTLLNRVNAIYERDLSLRLVLTGTAVFEDESTDPFKGLTDAEAILNKNVEVLAAQVGNDRFDVGHHVGVGGGGVAALASICSPNEKAAGYTAGNPPVGDAYVVDFVAHELGHQLGANHSYNAASGGSCSTRNAATAFEALSGVSIMSYTNICDGVDVAPQADDQFHAVSLKEILETLAGTGSCLQTGGGANSPPVITASPPATIPARTPFFLAASATDPDPADAGRLTWSFEQYDLGPASNDPGDTGQGPFLRTYKPTTAPFRYVPTWTTILTRANQASPTYEAGGKTYYNPESLPTTDRTMKFRVVVRDNRVADGQVAGTVASADMTVSVVAAAGPFRVTEPNAPVTWTAGTPQTVRWDVANTDQAPISTTNVRIRLSVDGGSSFTTLAESVPNTGEATVVVPASVAPTGSARVAVYAVGGIYFDVSDSDFSITGGTASAPVASFTVSPAAPAAGQAVTFTDTSTGGPTSWSWTFGDGTSSTERNPVKVWEASGTYTVTLTAANDQGQGSASRRVTVGASSPGGAGSVFFVPVVLSSSGAGGSFYTSELTLTNRGRTTATVRFDYTAVAGGGTGAASAAESLGPGRQKVVGDAVEYLRSLGVPLPASGNRVGTLRVTFEGLASSGDAAVTVRTTTAVAQPPGRAGLSYPGVPASQALASGAYVGGLRYSATQDRSNLAVQNAGSSGDVSLRVTVVSGSPAAPFQRTLDDLTLAPGGFRQYSPADMGLADGFQGWAWIERVGGTAPWFAYGVVNDQANSDGSFIPPVPAERAGGANGQTLPVVVETSTFSSEVAIANLGAAQATARLTLAPTSGGEYAWDVTLAPGEQRILPDFVAFLRASGVAVPPGTIVGPLFLTAPGGDARSFFLGARTSAPGGGGRFGLFYVAVPSGTAATGSAWLNALQQNAENRTNVAFVNTGEGGGGPISLRLEVFDGATGERVATVDDRLASLAARGFSQLNGVLADYGVAQGYIRVTRTSGASPFVCYAVINDGGVPNQRTDDGAFVPYDLPQGP